MVSYVAKFDGSFHGWREFADASLQQINPLVPERHFFGSGEGLQCFRRKEKQAALFPAVSLHHFQPGDRTGPTGEIRARLEIPGLSGDGEKSFLQNVIGQMTVTDEGADKPPYKIDVGEEEALHA